MMGAEDLKRWHWVVMGLLLGLFMSWVRVEMADSELPFSISAARFQYSLELSPAYDAATKRYIPHIYDVTVSPHPEDPTRFRVFHTRGDG